MKQIFLVLLVASLITVAYGQRNAQVPTCDKDDLVVEHVNALVPEDKNQDKRVFAVEIALGISQHHGLTARPADVAKQAHDVVEEIYKQYP